MASNSNPDDGWMEKAGFWHLLHDQDRNWEEEYQSRVDHMKHQLCMQEYKLSGAHEEVCAIQNIMAVLRYIVRPSGQKSSDDAIEKLENIRTDPTFIQSRVNTLGNLAGIYHRENRQEEATAIEDMLRNNEPTDLETARAMCEKGYFCLYHIIGEVTDKRWGEKALQLLTEGLSKGEIAQMPRREEAVWRFYLFEVKRRLFVGKIVEKHSTRREEFQDLVDAYDAFHRLWQEESGTSQHLTKHMDSANLDMATLFIRNEKHLDETVINGSESDKLRSIYGSRKQKKFNIFDEVGRRNSDDYIMHIKAVRVYTHVRNFEEAERFINRSNQAIDRQQCSRRIKNALKQNGITCKASLFLHRARANQPGNLKKGFKYIESLKEEHDYLATTACVEMADICYSIAVDETQKRKPMPLSDRNDYLAKALEYGEKAERGLNTTPRLYRIIKACHEILGNDQKVVQYAKKLRSF